MLTRKYQYGSVAPIKDEDGGSAVIYAPGKGKRMKDEKKLKTLKWNFITPRDDIVKQLKTQMTPCFSGSMLEKLFNDDFKFHIEAITLLSGAVSSNRPAVIESLDLILRWFTLRFFDTKTTVLLKCLECLDSLFDMLYEENYQLLEYEGSAFVPYLILKIGDSKENVRQSVHSLFIKLTAIYPATDLFKHFLDGLASKSSKIRIECLNELCVLLTKYGMEICEPTQAKALATIAKQIGHRDKGVRSAALNTIVEAYNIVGEEIFILIGELNEKDLTFLEEKIKRLAIEKQDTATETVALVQCEEIFRRQSYEFEMIRNPKQCGSEDSLVKNEGDDNKLTAVIITGKQRRIKDEENLKTFNWNFTTPRDEMVQQLKGQMTPCFSGSMIKKLFHDDFKFHIEAIALLSENVSSNRPAVIESLDIILRWFSLRCFDTNSAVLLKSLEFLESLFDMLCEEKYTVLEYEASAFVPFLILKIGDSMDCVRKSVHNLLRKLAAIYPPRKLFKYLLDGLKLKNSKARIDEKLLCLSSECLNELGALISKFGMDVCKPAQAKALKIIAEHTEDRDTAVRSAALNAIVEAYNIDGEQIFKLIARPRTSEPSEKRGKKQVNIDELKRHLQQINMDCKT